MTLPRLLALTGSWKSAPPIRRMVAQYFGVGKEEARPAANDYGTLMGVEGVQFEGNVL